MYGICINFIYFLNSIKVSTFQRSSLGGKVFDIMISCIGEIFGTFLLTLVICTVVAAAVMSGTISNIIYRLQGKEIYINVCICTTMHT